MDDPHPQQQPQLKTARPHIETANPADCPGCQDLEAGVTDQRVSPPAPRDGETLDDAIDRVKLARANAIGASPGSMQPIGRVIRPIKPTRSDIVDEPESEPTDDNNLLGDGGPPCETCHGLRKVRRNLPLTHPEFGRAIQCTAPECLNWIKSQRMSRLMKGLPDLYQDWWLATFPQDTPEQIRVLDWLVEWRDLTSGEGRWHYPPWLYLYGPSGHGKSGLATGLIKDAIARGQNAHLVKVDVLLAYIRSTYDSLNEYRVSETQIVEALGDYDELALDDLGVERHKREHDEQVDWATELLHRVIGGRHDAHKRTIITSNVNLNGLTRILGHERTASRIEEACGVRWIINVKDLPNLRKAT